MPVLYFRQKILKWGIETMDGQQCLRNPDIEPSDEVIARALGAANEAYHMFANGLAGHDIEVEWRYYKDGGAWLGKGLYRWTTVRGASKEATAFWLSIWEGSFRVTFFMPEKVRAEALKLPLDDETRERIAEAKQMGKLKFFPLLFDLCSDEQFDTVYALADFRKLIK